VSVTKVAARDVSVEAHAPVELRPLAQADIGSKTLGYLDAVLVDRGDRVKRGQVVALVRPSDLPDQLDAARGTLAQTEAYWSLARTNAERSQKLAPSGIISQQELQASAAALASATAAQAAAQAQAAAIAVSLGETRIQSPLDGVVAVRRLESRRSGRAPGGRRDHDRRSHRHAARVHHRHGARRARDHRGARCSRGARRISRTDVHRGRSRALPPTLDPTTRTLDAEVQIPNPDGSLRPGMFGPRIHRDGRAPSRRHRPGDAMQLSDNKAFVYVLAGEKVQRRAVQTEWTRGPGSR